MFASSDDEDDHGFDYEKYKRGETDNAFNGTFFLITAQYCLYLSGTPFRLLDLKGQWSEKTPRFWAIFKQKSLKMRHF